MTSLESMYKTLGNLLTYNDIDKITVSMICKNSNVNRNTFYYYFQNIREFYKQFLSYSIVDKIKDYFKKEKFIEAYNFLVQYTLDNKKMMFNIITHMNTLTTFVNFFKNDLRYVSKSFFLKIAKRFNLDFSDEFYKFINYEFVEKYLDSIKRIVIDKINPDLLIELFPNYINSLEREILIFSKLNISNIVYNKDENSAE